MSTGPDTYNLGPFQSTAPPLGLERPTSRETEEYILQLVDRTGLPNRASKAIESIAAGDYERAIQHLTVLTRK